MGKVVGGLLSIVGLGSGAKAPQPTPASAPVNTVTEAPVDETKQEQTKAKTARASLYATAGGVQGQDLNPDQVKKRNTLLGN